MNNNMYSAELQELYAKRSSAKTKLTLGIVFMSIATFLEFIGLILVYSFDLDLMMIGSILIFLSLPFWGVGIPFLIVGIINTAKSNTRIARIKSAGNRAAYGQQCGTYGQPQSANPEPNTYTFQQ